MSARKDDAEKPPFQLVPPEFPVDVALAAAAEALAGRVVVRGLAVVFDAALQRLLSWWDGEDVDPESGLPHLAHAAALVMSLRAGGLSLYEKTDAEAAEVAGAAPLHLLDAGFLRDVARVFGFGSAKYGAWNWLEHPKGWGRDWAAALRHLLAWRDEEDLDSESGLPHLAHAAACVAIVHGCQRRGLGEDDRPRIKKEAVPHAPRQHRVHVVEPRRARATRTPSGSGGPRWGPSDFGGRVAADTCAACAVPGRCADAGVCLENEIADVRRARAEALAVVRDDETARPQVVCLCGSTRYKDAFDRANREETLAGRVVLSVGDWDRSASATTKALLDVLHLKKIEMADEVFVLNVGGYVGESTRREVLHAMALGRRVRWLEPDLIPDDLQLVGEISAPRIARVEDPASRDAGG